jgi:hypothetical protein
VDLWLRRLERRSRNGARTTPAPRNQRGKNTTQDRADATCECPNSFGQAHQQTPLSQTEQVTDTDMDQQDEPAAGGALEGSRNNQRLHGLGRRADGRARKEEGQGQQDDQLAAPDVGELGPDGTRGGIGKEVCCADPCVASGRGEVGRDGGCRGCNDGGIEGGDEERELAMLMQDYKYTSIDASGRVPRTKSANTMAPSRQPLRCAPPTCRPRSGVDALSAASMVSGHGCCVVHCCIVQSDDKSMWTGDIGRHSLVI